MASVAGDRDYHFHVIFILSEYFFEPIAEVGEVLAAADSGLKQFWFYIELLQLLLGTKTVKVSD